MRARPSLGQKRNPRPQLLKAPWVWDSHGRETSLRQARMSQLVATRHFASFLRARPTAPPSRLSHPLASGGFLLHPGEAACDASPAAELTARRAGCVCSQDPSRAPGPKASAAARLPSEGPGGRRGGRSAPWGTGQRGAGGEGESCAQWPGDCRGHGRTRVGPPRGRDAATETPTTRKHLENGLMMFYNRNELYSYS